MTIEHALGLHQSGKLAEAEAIYREILLRQPGNADALHLLGLIAYQSGRYEAALDLIGRAVAVRPMALYLENFGQTLVKLGKFDEAIAVYQRALALGGPRDVLNFAMGEALQRSARFDEAVTAYRQAIAINPNYPEAYCDLGAALYTQGRIDEAIACYHSALALRSDYSNALNNLAGALKDCGRMDEAIACYDRLISRESSPIWESSQVYALHFHPDYDAEALLRELRVWNERHAKPLKAEILPHTNDPSPDRRLKIGYVSPDFYQQAESFFVVPLLESHDHSAFEIFCYSSVRRPDVITQRIARAADVWRDVRNTADAELARVIRDDGIDILIDLTMHLTDNRLLLFARKPAPVQACWLAYPGGTGVAAIDWRITDRFLDPPDSPLHYAEKSLPLPGCWCCYDSLTDIPPVPAEPGSPIHFGSLNHPGKLNDGTLRLWAAVLNATGDSRLLVQSNSQHHSQQIREILQSEGVDPARAEFVGRLSRDQYLRYYDRIDIALDTLPYNGITTTCDALWMGVPVVSLTGRTAAGRAGWGLLATIGLEELVAKTPGQFVQIASGLAGDLSRLTKLRGGLRERMRQSPLMNFGQFARHMEAAYRHMWLAWIAEKR